MTTQIIYSYWSADRNPFVERTTQAIEVIEKMFPLATIWDARPSQPKDHTDRFRVIDDEEIRNYGERLSRLWEATLAYFSAQDRDLNQFVVNSSAYSKDMGLAIRALFADFELTIEVDPVDLESVLTDHFDNFLLLLRELGACPAIGGCWLRQESAFAGSPICLYKPKVPFAKLEDVLRYDQVRDDVRAIRESARVILQADTFSQIFGELSLNAEPLQGDRIYVRLGAPKGDGGIWVLERIERKIMQILKSQQSEPTRKKP